MSREEERNSAELSELQHLHQVMNGIGVTVIHGNHPKLPDVCLMCERDSPETTVSIWEENPIQEPNVLTIEAVCINGKEEKDEILLELTRLQRELMDVEKENERILTSLEEVVINEIQEAQHLRDSYHDPSLNIHSMFRLIILSEVGIVLLIHLDVRYAIKQLRVICFVCVWHVVVVLISSVLV